MARQYAILMYSHLIKCISSTVIFFFGGGSLSEHIFWVENCHRVKNSLRLLNYHVLKHQAA